MSVSTKFGASYSRPGSFEGIWRKIADRAAKKAEEAKAIAALVDAGPGVPMRARPEHGGKQFRKSKLGLIVRRTNR